ncbi:MAG TPA: Gfo/Idh/MocA family oxidoreductase [Candidatus Pelethocola excrementipullorum]|nr:Gfo/Idh/MocA family oxidoreductase [Candidatus Pelethocola excrementipullorum]
MKVGIIGAGHIACKMAVALNGLDDTVAAYGVASRDLAKAEEFAKEWGFQKAYGSYEELVKDPDIDLVYIATPHSLHFEQAKLSLEHGKAVLCEKAFTMNAKQARELTALAKEKKLLLAEAIWTRYMPSRKMIDDLVESGVIGKVTSLSANLGYVMEYKERMQRPELAGGALLDLGVYPINFASMVFGDKIKEISSTCVKTETGVDSQDSITIVYEDGRVAYLYATMLAQTDRQGVINGDKGYIEIQNINNCEEIRVYNLDREMTARYQVPEQINGYEYEVLACKEALEKGELECSQMPHKEIIRIMEVMDGLRESWGVKFPGEE